MARSARGTQAVPGAVLAGDRIATYGGQGFDGAAFQPATTVSGMYSDATENWAVGAHGSNVRFTTTANGAVAATTRVVITENGDVGIGVAPAHRLHVQGTAGLSSGTAWINTSDIRLKDVHGKYERGLAELLKLSTIRFNYKENNPLKLPSDKEMIGFSAQQVRTVIPEAVVARADGYLELNVDPIHWTTVNAVQELYRRCEETRIDQGKRLADLERTNGHLAQELANVKHENETLRSESTAIKVWICSSDPQAPFCK